VKLLAAQILHINLFFDTEHQLQSKRRQHFAIFWIRLQTFKDEFCPR